MPSPARTAKPVILLSARHQPDEGREKPERSILYAAYYDAVTRAGGLPLVALPVSDADDLARMLDVADGILLTGGPDLSGETFGQPDHSEARLMTPRRQRFDLGLARAALERRMPILGICLGVQVLNVAAGGALHQHLPEGVGRQVNHHAEGVAEAHPVAFDPGSRIARLTGTTRLLVNSTHHQAVDRVADGLTPTGRSETDGVVEVIEAVDPDHFALGVQWHPERLGESPPHLALFRGLVEAAAS